MSDAETVDQLDALLVPFEGDDPCGEDQTWSGVFRDIMTARTEDDPDAPQGVWETEIRRADWPKVEELCSTGLKTMSKDLRFSLWLTEAWTKQEGLNGFRRGIDLTVSLCEEFWDDLYPKIDEDGDLEPRLGPLHLAATQFERHLVLMPITAPAAGEMTQMRLKDLNDVQRIENLAMRDEAAAAKEEARYLSRQQFENAVSLTPVEWFQDQLPLIEASLGEIERLDLFFEEHCPRDGPSLSELRKTLERIDQLTRQWVLERGGSLAAEESEPEDAAEGADDTGEEAAMSDTKPADAASQDSSGGVAAGPITNRAEAYRRLEEIADFLVRAEPHSPTPYLIRRAVSWGNMSFGELLVELMESGGDHQRVLRLLGLDEMGKSG